MGAMALISSAYLFLTTMLVTYKDSAMTKGTEWYNLASNEALDLFTTAKTKAMPYWQSLDKNYKLQDKFASYNFEALYASLKKQAMAFITATWEQLEALLQNALENE